MTIVEWTPDLNTGIPDIDEQHKQMLHHINDFYEAANAKDKDRMSIVLFDLINSTLAHFQYEEALMEQAKYPLLEPHRRVHKNFIDKLMNLHEKLQTMETTDDIAVLLIDSLDGWLFRHIRINDKGYTNSVNESGVYQAMHENLVAARAAQMQEYGEVAEPEPQPKPAPQPVQPKPAPRPAPQAQAAPTQPKAEPKPAPATQPQNKEPEDDEPRGWASGNWKF
ncbi:bacteriohemerythrin [Kingella oralis]|uniref:bacteriohemerythrin n=1 Tax=Kingella oralis TaxID=505 RepID=UPI0028EAE511|nr:bacteriohemerythrin [Kingella oralis]